MLEVLQAIRDDRSRLVGTGEWVKNSCYHVHEVEGRFYVIVVADQRDMWLVDETLEEIKEEDIEKYVEKF